MSPGWRKLSLTAHVTTSVAFLGAVGAFLALAIAGVTDPEVETVRAAYEAMSLITSLVIVPLCFASLVSGVVSSLGTSWGLFRHYWVLAKLLLTILTTIVLLVHTKPIDLLAAVATRESSFPDDLESQRRLMVVAAGLAMLALILATALSIYKPKGMTRYGWRKQRT